MTKKYSAPHKAESALLPSRQPDYLLTQPISIDGTPEYAPCVDGYVIAKCDGVPRYRWNVLRSSGQLDEGWIDTEIIDKKGMVLVRMVKPVHRSNIDKLEKCVPLAVLKEQNIDFTNAYLQRAYGVIIKDGRLQPVADTTHATTSSQERQTEILPAQRGDTHEHRSGDSARQLVGSVAAKASDGEVDNSPLVERVLGRVE